MVKTFDGVQYFWYPASGAIDLPIARKEGEDYDSVEVLCKPPYEEILPCPWCGTCEERKHDPIKHVNPKLGRITST